ncbi:hypothetical protein LguiA_036654 [Lonicera macranthoides]
MNKIFFFKNAAVDLIKNVEVEAIIGPSTSMQTKFILDLGDKANVPIISFSATSSSISTIRNPYFIRATQNDSSQVKAISAIIKAFGWKTVVPIYAGDDFGHGIMPYLISAFQGIDVRVHYQSIISPLATDSQILGELHKLIKMQTRVFVVHMGLNLGSRFFTKAKEAGMMEEGYVWIITDGLANILSSMDSLVIDSMQGVLGVKPYVPGSKQRTDFIVRWKRKFQQENPNVADVEINVFGLWAYDTMVALAMAAEKVEATKFGFKKEKASRKTNLESFGVSTSGPELLQALNSTTFRGLSGDFHLVDGQLNSSVYQFVNVIKKRGRRIGFWTERYGISKILNFSDKSSYSTSKDQLGAIVWPGDTTFPPSGWVTMKIGVPAKTGFREFVNVTRNPDGDTNNVSGYSIAVFNAVIAALPYHVNYNYSPFQNNIDGTPRGNYNDLVYQVYAGEYDAVVGDITIIANRSNFVDFTLRYTESGVSLVVPIKDNKRKNALVFLKPFTWGLWVTSLCSFVFIGFVIWILEHRINEDFRGPPSHQIGMIFYFSFTHEEKVLSNLGRFILIIWVFVVLILTQSYTASLASILTVQQLQPTVTDVTELVKTGMNVGYLRDSFTLGLLKGMNFSDANLKAFPRGSPLVSDVSRAILNVTEGEKMIEIEKIWFTQNTTCPDTSFSSNNLGLESFWGLFLIAFIASISALVIYMAKFLHEHWHVLSHLEPQTSLWKKIVVLATHLDKKDLNSYTFKRTELHVGNETTRADREGAVEPSPDGTDSTDNGGPPSPSSNNTENFSFHEEQDIQAQTGREIVPEIELAISTEN